ncbi:LysR family transcriptional regulator [Rhodococcus sp. T2V]|nr:LysR family transcriptional regulator [Rhodococcus sp. T2V]
MSQSALSRAIGRLEGELGVPLFDRVGRTVRLNRYGEIFRVRVEEAFKALDTGWSEITDAVDPNRGIVTMAFIPTIGPTLVPRLLREFRHTHANVRFQLSQGGAGSVVGMLLDGSVDLCLTAPDPRVPGVEWVPLWKEPMVLAVPDDHQLASSDTVKLADLAEVPVVTLKRGFGIRQITDELFEEVGVTPTIVFEAADVPTVRGLVAAGLGVAVLPASPDAHQVGLPVEVPISDVDTSRVVGVARVISRYMPAAAHAFLEHVRSTAETPRS